MGIGGEFWKRNCANNCFLWQGANGNNFALQDDAYRCVNAQREYYKLGLRPTVIQGRPLLVNHAGQLGNVCVHWSDGSFRVAGISSELMTPFFESGVAQPLSTVTIGALQDMGYKVNYDAADSFPDKALVPNARRHLKTGNHRRHHRPVTSPEHSFDLSLLIDHIHTGTPHVIVVKPWE